MDEGIYQQAGDGATQIGRARDVYIDTRRPPVGVPFQAPAVPRYFVPRPEVSQALMDYLMAEAPTGALVVSAIHGLGGIGKTTLVAALAHDPEVQTRFPDGVLWATLGQQPDVLSLLAGWIQALGDYDFRLTVVESASAHLRTLLHDKACLLVVDDAWQADHARPFLVGGSRCRLVVTTRNAVLARKVGARLYDLDVMTETQALALFQARLGPLDGNREQAAALARELGYLPLALELAAAQVEAGLSWTELLDAFRRAQADLAALDLDDATYRNESLRLSFHLSLEQLSLDDQDAFAWLGVLPEDARLNPTMAATLWDQPEVDARKRLRRLRDRALLKQVGDDRYTVHDLLHYEAKLRLSERMPLPEAHAALLAHYRQKVPDEQWHRLPDDGYIHEHLTWHMEQAGQPEAIHALLREETAQGRNGWHETRERLGQMADYMDDVRRSWRLAEEEFILHSSPLAIGLQCRYALITTSLNSLVKNIPTSLLVTLVAQKVWSPTQGLAYARQSPDPVQRAGMLSGLIPHLVEMDHLQKALIAAQEVEDIYSRAGRFKLLDVLSGKTLTGRWALQEAMTSAFSGLALNLSDTLLPKALAVAQKIEDEYARALALSGLASHLPELQLREALVIASKIRDKNARLIALAGFPPHPLLLLLLEASASMFSGLIPHLPDTLLPEALAAAETEDEYARALILSRLAPHLSETQLQEVLVAFQKIQDKENRALALSKLAPYLSKALKDQTLQEVLALVAEIEDEYSQCVLLSGLTPHLSKPQLQEVLATAKEIQDGYARALALSEMAPHLSKPQLQEVLAAAREIQDEYAWAMALLGLVPRLAELGHPEEALTVAWEIQDEDCRAQTFSRLAPYLSEGVKEQALGEALATARKIRGRSAKALALLSLHYHLPEQLQRQVLREALVAVREIRDTEDREEAFWVLLGWLQHPLLAVRKIEDGHTQALILLKLTPHLPDPLRERMLEETSIVQEVPDRGPLSIDSATTEAPVELVPHRPECQLDEALAAAREIRTKGVRTFLELIPHLTESLRGQVLEEALAAVREMPEQRTFFRTGSSKTEAMVELAPHLPKGLVAEALAMVCEIENSDARAEALAALAPQLARLESARLGSLWRETSPMLAARTRKDLLADLRALFLVIATLGGKEAIVETLRAIQDVGRWWP